MNNYHSERIEAPYCLKKVMFSLTKEEREHLANLKECENFDAIEDFLNKKFSQLPPKEEQEIKVYFDRKNCAELGIPYPPKKT